MTFLESLPQTNIEVYGVNWFQNKDGKRFIGLSCDLEKDQGVLLLMLSEENAEYLENELLQRLREEQ